jgi:hypothetical protein
MGAQNYKTAHSMSLQSDVLTTMARQFDQLDTDKGGTIEKEEYPQSEFDRYDLLVSFTLFGSLTMRYVPCLHYVCTMPRTMHHARTVY